VTIAPIATIPALPDHRSTVRRETCSPVDLRAPRDIPLALVPPTMRVNGT